MGLLLLLRLVHFMDPVAEYNGPTGFMYAEWIGLEAPNGSWFWVTALLLVQLFIILLICLRLKVSSETTLLPGLVFVLFVSLIPEVGKFHPVILANTFLLLALQQLFSISPRKSSGKQIFNVGIWIALATLFYSSYIFFLIAAVSGVNIIRSYRFNDVKVLALGYITPFFLVGVHYFWFDRLVDYGNGIFDGLGLISFRNMDDWFHIGTAIFVLLIVMAMILNFAQVMNKKTNVKQNYFKTLYWFLASCFIMSLMQKEIGVEHLMVLTIPLSMILSEYLVNWKKFKSQVMVNVILAMVILYQLKDLILNAL